MWDQLEPVAIYGLAGAFIGFVIWIGTRWSKKEGRTDQQQAELEQFVRERGWSYTACVSGGGDRYCGSPPFPLKGVDVDVWDHIAGEFRGRTFCCFEYRWLDTDADEDGTGTTNRWRYNAVYAVTTPTPVPRTSVRRPRALERLDARMLAGLRGSGQVVQLGIPEFDKEFLITADDERFVRNVMAGLAPFLPSDPRAQDGPLSFHGNELITWHEGRLRPEHVEPKLNYLHDILGRIPAEAWRQA